MIQFDEHIFQLGWNHQLDIQMASLLGPANFQHHMIHCCQLGREDVFLFMGNPIISHFCSFRWDLSRNKGDGLRKSFDGTHLCCLAAGIAPKKFLADFLGHGISHDGNTIIPDMGPHMLLFLMGHCLSLNLDELIEKIIGVSAWLNGKPHGAPKKSEDRISRGRYTLMIEVHGKSLMYIITTVYVHETPHIYIYAIYIYLEPKWPLFWLEFRPCFGGFTFKNRGHLGSRYRTLSNELDPVASNIFWSPKNLWISNLKCWYWLMATRNPVNSHPII